MTGGGYDSPRSVVKIWARSTGHCLGTFVADAFGPLALGAFIHNLHASNVVPFGAVTYPQSLARCTGCHVDGKAYAARTSALPITVDAGTTLTNDAAAPGDALVLTKPLGTGLVATAIKRLEVADAAPAGRIGPLVAEAIAEMSRLNRDAALVARRAGARAATDVTGFGLAGHLHKICLLYTSPSPRD